MSYCDNCRKDIVWTPKNCEECPNKEYQKVTLKCECTEKDILLFFDNL